MLMLADPALAADLPLKTPALRAVYDWTGFYVGGHVGYGGGSFGPETHPLPEQGVVFPHSVTGLIGGYQIGYNRQFANRVVLGIEADSTFTSPLDGPALVRMPPSAFNTTLDYIGTVRGRIGYAFGTLMPYATFGFAWGHTHAEINDGSGAIIGHYQPGWTAGLGLEYAFRGNWSAKVEYLYADLGTATCPAGTCNPLVPVDIAFKTNLVRLGLNYRF